jgi:hypothetical protein
VNKKPPSIDPFEKEPTETVSPHRAPLPKPAKPGWQDERTEIATNAVPLPGRGRPQAPSGPPTVRLPGGSHQPTVTAAEPKVRQEWETAQTVPRPFMGLESVLPPTKPNNPSPLQAPPSLKAPPPGPSRVQRAEPETVKVSSESVAQDIKAKQGLLHPTVPLLGDEPDDSGPMKVVPASSWHPPEKSELIPLFIDPSEIIDAPASLDASGVGPAPIDHNAPSGVSPSYQQFESDVEPPLDSSLEPSHNSPEWSDDEPEPQPRLRRGVLIGLAVLGLVGVLVAVVVSLKTGSPAKGGKPASPPTPPVASAKPPVAETARTPTTPAPAAAAPAVTPAATPAPSTEGASAVPDEPPPPAPDPKKKVWTLPGHYKLGFVTPPKGHHLAGVVKKAIRACPGKVVVIYGHSCDVGGEAVRQRIGLERAEAMKSRLVRLGLPAQALKTGSKGDSEPVADNDTPLGRLKNRRVTLECAQPR